MHSQDSLTCLQFAAEGVWARIRHELEQTIAVGRDLQGSLRAARLSKCSLNTHWLGALYTSLRCLFQFSGMQFITAPLQPCFSTSFPLYSFLAPKQKFSCDDGKGQPGSVLTVASNCINTHHIFNRFKTDISHKNFMGSTIQVLFYLAAFSSLKAFFHWDSTCSGNGIPLKIHISISWWGFLYFFSSLIRMYFLHISAFFIRSILLWVLY